MSDTEYGAALKLGKKQYQDAVAKGEYPYLPVLDDVLSCIYSKNDYHNIKLTSKKN